MFASARTPPDCCARARSAAPAARIASHGDGASGSSSSIEIITSAPSDRQNPAWSSWSRNQVANAARGSSAASSSSARAWADSTASREHRDLQLLAGRVVAVERADAHAGPARDLLERRAGAALREHLARGVEQTLGVALRIGTRRRRAPAASCVVGAVRARRPMSDTPL